MDRVSDITNLAKSGERIATGFHSGVRQIGIGFLTSQTRQSRANRDQVSDVTNTADELDIRV
ncbi:hypothetical protein AMTR_s00104p00072980 [Amborella trichopoda]|uniref:Uncharacterized protein n=1 Tax=Amborella trichopoda TaxID=13333 RepID=W1NYH3_AMBTC|nr:hypothetical protein AMTR_s00104p00072980 [Amborella trichopoda]